MSGAEQIEATAAEWLARRDGERWNADQQQLFDGWLQASTAHRVAYLRLESAWRRADRLADADLPSTADGSHRPARPALHPLLERFSPAQRRRPGLGRCDIR